MRIAKSLALLLAASIALAGCASFKPPTAKPADILTVLNSTSAHTKWRGYDEHNKAELAKFRAQRGAIDLILGGDCLIYVYRSAQSAFNALHAGSGAIFDSWFYPGEFKSLGTALGVTGKDERCAVDATGTLKLFSKVYGDNTTESYWTPTLAQIEMCISHHHGCIAKYSLAVPNTTSALHDPKQHLLQKLVDAGVCKPLLGQSTIEDTALNSCTYGSDVNGNPYTLTLYSADYTVFYDVVTTNFVNGSGKHILANDGWTLHSVDRDDVAILKEAQKVIGGKLINRIVPKHKHLKK